MLRDFRVVNQFPCEAHGERDDAGAIFFFSLLLLWVSPPTPLTLFSFSLLCGAVHDCVLCCRFAFAFGNCLRLLFASPVSSLPSDFFGIWPCVQCCEAFDDSKERSWQLNEDSRLGSSPVLSQYRFDSKK
eukprot:RCo027957